MSHSSLVVIVPDGLKANTKDGPALPEPSFVYRAVLDYAAEHFTNCPLILAPANSFGSPQTEQEAASAYLKDKGVLSLVVPSPKSTDYIDTRGNASLLRDYLQQAGQWPMPPVILLVAKRHALRAALCFRKEGFQIAQVIAAPYLIDKNERIVARLWYYRYPLCHVFYESLAILRDLFRHRRA